MRRFRYLAVREPLRLGVKVYDEWDRWVATLVHVDGQWCQDAPANLVKCEMDPASIVCLCRAAPIDRSQYVRRLVWRLLLTTSLGAAIPMMLGVTTVGLWFWTATAIIGAVGMTYEWLFVDRVRYGSVIVFVPELETE